MHIQVKGQKIKFNKVELLVLEQGIENLFVSFDKKTLNELTLQKKYEHLQEEASRHAQHVIDWPAGKALKQLKDEGNIFYKQFLNNYGDLTYTRFIVNGEDELLKQKGIYTIIVNNELKFCGVCARTFKERFNQHIGNIYAKGCFRDGTATHCHVNANITLMLPDNDVHFAIYPMEDEKEMNSLKNAIINRFEPEWNLRSNRDLYELTSVF
ncbi:MULTISPECIES: GIY-YIG nuclease family protein [Solibacillus]|uniref:GIY-YIG domain-containing protein n=1 Tax=Solibacillus merdavium TaxID=2762218 RepID=A0ABR8XLY6_9BACL|nr:hypothetical protein [Solibacillus merdavium]MBD8032940.1 hypothetical protein [Solibacillus merdavium]